METGLSLSREALIQLLLAGLRGANVIWALKKMGVPIEEFEMALLSARRR